MRAVISRNTVFGAMNDFGNRFQPKPLVMSSTVSYTHLDVYKRQAPLYASTLLNASAAEWVVTSPVGAAEMCIRDSIWISLKMQLKIRLQS